MKLRRLFILFVLVFTGWGGVIYAQRPLAQWDDQQGQVTLELTQVFDPPPPLGVQPVRATVRNATDESHAWDVSFVNGTGHQNRVASRFSLEVESHQEKSVIWLVPLVGVDFDYTRGATHIASRSISVTVLNSRRSVSQASHPYYPADQFPALAISDDLARNNLTQLNDELKKQRSFYVSYAFGSRYNPKDLPEEWLGYSGFDCVLMTTQEWQSLSPGARAALQQWVEMGGILHLYSPLASVNLASLGFKISSREENARNSPSSPLRMGFGQVVVQQWNGHTMDAAETVKYYLDTFSTHSSRLISSLALDYRTSGWGLMQALGERPYAGWQVVVFLILFGLLVGPVNLFVLAPRGRRHRLFLTTPLISLAASLLVLGVILLQDGLGGTGRRLTAIYLSANEAAAKVIQEQVSRTGMLFYSSLALPPETQLEAVALADSPWVKLFKAPRLGLKASYDGHKLSGNWFQSRTVQAQFIRSRIPGRGRIEWLASETSEGAPSILSSLGFTLEYFVCRDQQGRLWSSPGPVPQGQRVTLVPAIAKTYHQVLQHGLQHAASPLLSQLKETVDVDGFFLASATAAPGYTVDTLSSLQWEDDLVLVFGPLSEAP